jgi:hypothetical protein
VGSKLGLDRAAPNLSAIDQTVNWWAVVPSCFAVELDLVPASVASWLYRMEIHLSPIEMLEGNRGREPIAQHLKPLFDEKVSDDRHRVRFDYKVEVTVRPALLTDESIDSPATIDPGGDA